MKTITVRAAVAVDPETEYWTVMGDEQWSDEETMSEILTCADYDENAQLTWITAEIPIREPETIDASMEADDD